MSADQRELLAGGAAGAAGSQAPSLRRHLGLSQYDARVLTDEKPMADYFEAVVVAGADAKLAANWITGDIAAYVNSQPAQLRQPCPSAPSSWLRWCS